MHVWPYRCTYAVLLISSYHGTRWFLIVAMIDCRWYALGWWHFERGFAKKLAVTHFSKGKVWLRLRSSCKFKILQFWKTTCLPYLVNKWPRLKVANLDVAILQPVQKLNQAAGDILLSCYAHCCEFRFDQSLQLRETNEYISSKVASIYRYILMVCFLQAAAASRRPRLWRVTPTVFLILIIAIILQYCNRVFEQA